MQNTKWDTPTRLLHTGLVITITVQLMVSLVMQAPGARAHSALEVITYQVHRYVGLAALAVVLVHWVWSFATRGRATVRNLFPTTSNESTRVINEVRGIFAKQRPDSETPGGITGLVHGLGLLASTAIALTGAVLFAWWPDVGKPDQLTHTLSDVHSALSNLVWAYWIVHGGIALWHHYLGHDTLRAMFWRREKSL